MCCCPVTDKNLCCHAPLQVDRQLGALLPNAMLASAELVYLSALPGAEHQRLLAEWRQLVHAAIKDVDGLSTSAAEAGAANSRSEATKPGSWVATSASGTDPATVLGTSKPAGEKYYRPLLELFPAGLLSTAANPTMLQLASTLQLLQPGAPITQQLQYVAAAVQLALDNGVPLVVIDSWDLLPQLLLDDDSSSASGSYVRQQSSSWQVVPAWSVHADISQYSTKGIIMAVRAALEEGADVLLQLHCSGQQAVEIVKATAALYNRLRVQSLAPADTDQCSSRHSTLVSIASEADSIQSRTFMAGPQGYKSPRKQQRSDASARQPRLVVQITSSNFSQPAELLGLCQMVDLSGVYHPAYHAQGSSCEAHKSAQVKKQGVAVLQPLECDPYLPELVLALVLQAVAPSQIAAVSAAAMEAEQIRMQLETDEADFMRRLAQVCVCSCKRCHACSTACCAFCLPHECAGTESNTCCPVHFPGDEMSVFEA